MKRSSGHPKVFIRLTGMLTAGVLCLTLLAPVRAADLVKVGYQPFLSFMALFIGIEKGYFKEQNVDLEMIRFKSGTHMLPALAIGEIAVASGASGGPFYNAIAQKTGFKIVADKGRIKKNYGFTVAIVRKSLYDSGKVRSLKDLFGLKVGQFTKTSISAFVMDRMMNHAGLDYDKLNLVYLNPPKQFQALASGAIDAAMTVEPWGRRAVDKGMAAYLAGPDAWLGERDFQIAVIMYSGKFIKEQRDVA